MSSFLPAHLLLLLIFIKVSLTKNSVENFPGVRLAFKNLILLSTTKRSDLFISQLEKQYLQPYFDSCVFLCLFQYWPAY